ncbi:fungal-specific transcription factor domain-containing protein [Aspergillus ambiguus]|uniref:Zn(II)2Cys6 transcription factor n=1 Tax=Aspergillus ambiguus TaxID=176160 RepID=UPI003CCD7661
MAERRTQRDNTHSSEELTAHPNDEHSSIEVPSKRQKRGKYARACGECSRRKIKCDGRIPCAPCHFHGRTCVMPTNDLRRRRPANDIEISQPPNEWRNHDQAGEYPTTKELAARLSRVEHQLELVLSSISSRSAGEREPLLNTADDDTPSLHATKTQLQTFAGETSISHTLNQIEGYLDYQEYPSMRRESTTSLASLPMSPVEYTSHPYTITGTRKALAKHGVKPNKGHWDSFMKTFCDEVHILYPFLHIASLWDSYACMWRSNFALGTRAHTPNDHRIAIAQVWICLALGKCTESPRVHTEEGKHSAGWSLFSAAIDLIGDLLGCFRICSDATLVLQTFSLMAVYLFRLDANERAEKYLALAISHAHHLGFHRSKVVLQMPVFRDEMVRRLWWCLHAMDRRFSIETGHPFIIQDVNVDVPEPRNLSDEWLIRFKRDARTSSEVTSEIESELAQDFMTPIPYLSATIRYSRIIGKIWEAIYGAHVTDTFPRASLLQYLEQLFHGAQKEIKPEFSAITDSGTATNAASSDSPWWRTKQQMLMRIRWLSLRILIRKSILHQNKPSSETKLDVLENEIICIQTGCQIIHEFQQVADEGTVSAYPFIHSLVGATVVSLGLIVKEPSFKNDYGDMTLHAAISLERYCHRTWVSGRMLRTICRLNQIASRVLSSNGTLAVRGRNAGKNASSNSPAFHPRRSHEKAFSDSFAGTTVPSVSPLPAEDRHGSTDFATSRTIEAPQAPFSAVGISDHLVMRDFDFEQSFINDIVPLGQSYGFSDIHSEMQPATYTGAELDWLESLLSGDMEQDP